VLAGVGLRAGSREFLSPVAVLILGPEVRVGCCPRALVEDDGLKLEVWG